MGDCPSSPVTWSPLPRSLAMALSACTARALVAAGAHVWPSRVSSCSTRPLCTACWTRAGTSLWSRTCRSWQASCTTSGLCRWRRDSASEGTHCVAARAWAHAWLCAASCSRRRQQRRAGATASAPCASWGRWPMAGSRSRSGGWRCRTPHRAWHKSSSCSGWCGSLASRAQRALRPSERNSTGRLRDQPGFWTSRRTYTPATTSSPGSRCTKFRSSGSLQGASGSFLCSCSCSCARRCTPLHSLSRHSSFHTSSGFSWLPWKRCRASVGLCRMASRKRGGRKRSRLRCRRAPCSLSAAILTSSSAVRSRRDPCWLLHHWSSRYTSAPFPMASLTSLLLDMRGSSASITASRIWGLLEAARVRSRCPSTPQDATSCTQSWLPVSTWITCTVASCKLPHPSKLSRQNSRRRCPMHRDSRPGLLRSALCRASSACSDCSKR
uniref:C2H2-type domain-containing protein n=1 Tax=Ixodes ricinus TaxID=34613 RepID=A0A6B0VAT3_IXORI